jgi:hypothetical protein
MSILPTQSERTESKLEVPNSQPVPDSSSEKLDLSTPEKFQPGWRFIAAFGSLCIITLMAALDATSLSVALPVRETTLNSRHNN